MAISLSEQQSIIRLAVGMFNAAPGATYMNTLVGIFEANGHNMTALANTLSDLPAFEGIYNDGLTSDQFATAFLSTLNLQDNDFALDWVSSRDEAGVLSRGEIIRQAVEALSTSGATAFQEAKAILNNKVEVATFFTIDQNNPETNLAELQAVLATITADHATVDAAIFGIENPPQTFDLTINADVGAAFTGGAGNDTFTADAALSTVDLVLRPTLGGNDDLHGGAGFDVLNAVVNGNFGLAAGDAPHIAEIEQLNFTVRSSGSILSPDDNFAAIDFGHVTGANEVNMVGSDDGSGLSIFNVQEAINIGINGLDDGYMNVSFDDNALDSDAASQLVTIQDVSGSVLNIDANGDDVLTDLTLMVVGGGSNDMTLNVQSDGNYSLQHLTINGGGDLELSSYDDFSELVSLNSTGLAGDLEIDISGGLNVESVTTGAGDDSVTVDADLFDGDMEVAIDLGGGDNTLTLTNHDEYAEFTDVDLNAIDFSAATVSNVQTLQLDGYVDLNDDAALDVSTIGGLQTLSILGDFIGDGYSLDLTGPATLAVEADAFFNTNLMTTGILDLTLASSDGDVDLDSLTSEDITSLTVVADDGDDEEDANAWVDLDGADDNLVTLANVNVSADGNVHLEVNGVAGEAAVPPEGGTVESGSFTLSGFDKNTGSFTGNVVITSDGLPGGELVVDVSGANNIGQVTDAVIAALNGTDLITASEGDTDQVLFTWDDVGNMDDISVSFDPDGGDDALSTGTVAIVQGTDPDVEGIPATPGTGFEGLTTVVVDAGGNGEVDMANAMGAFSVTVTAGDDADVDLTDTGVTTVSATGDNAFVLVEGAEGLTAVTATADDVATVTIVDAEALTTVTVTAGDDEGGNFLTLVNTDAVNLIDLTNITDNDDGELSGDAFITVDVDEADFAGPVSVVIGEENLLYTTDATNNVGETFTFVGDVTGAVTIEGFKESIGNNGDRIDFSQLAGIDDLQDLNISFVGGNTIITEAAGGTVHVDIVVMGTDLTDEPLSFVF